MKIHKLNQIDARNRHLRTNVKLSQCKAIAVSEEKLDKYDIYDIVIRSNVLYLIVLLNQPARQDSRMCTNTC